MFLFYSDHMRILYRTRTVRKKKFFFRTIRVRYRHTRMVRTMYVFIMSRDGESLVVSHAVHTSSTRYVHSLHHQYGNKATQIPSTVTVFRLHFVTPSKLHLVTCCQK